MAKIIDRRKQAMGGGSKRSISQIKNIAIHYSATATGNTASFERFWKGTRGWNTGGYHEVILTDGTVELNYDANVISNGVGGQNTRMYNMCYVGAGKPNAAQLKTLIERANYNRKRFGLAANAVKGHREYAGQSTSCPALNMTDFRKALAGGSAKPSASKPASKPKRNYLAQGDRGAAVRSMQTHLIRVGYSVGKAGADGIFGKDTDRALRRFQADYGLGVDGKYGPQSRGALEKAKAPSKRKKGESLAVDGYLGRLTISALQRYFKTPVDGVISKPKSTVVVALQKWLGVTADGIWGAQTTRALQRRLGTPVDGVISKPSAVIKELQRRLNRGKL